MDDPRVLLRTQRIDSLYATVPPSVVAGAVMSTLLVALFWPTAPRVPLLAWLALIWLLLAARAALWLAYRRRRAGMAHPPRGWARAAIGHMAVAGCAWGAGLGWLAIIATPLQLVVVVSTAIGAISLTMADLSYRQNHAAFQVPVLAAIGAAALLAPHPGFWMLAVAAGLLCLAQLVVARRVNETYLTALRVSIDNERLAHDLRERSAELERAVAELKTLSLTDALTGIANRRAFTERLQAEWVRLQRKPAPLALLAIDVDHFKRYNDSHGHDAGDRCLQVVAQVMLASVRAGIDLAARPGGEEFAVLLPATGLADAALIAERVRAGIERATLDAAIGLPSPATVSIGLAVLDAAAAAGASQAQLLRAADQALYRAKAGGRNRVVEALA